MEVRDRHLTPGFDLVVKHNALFTALLPDLLSAFPVYGIVRNPLAVLASWNAVNLPVKQGRIPAERSSPLHSSRSWIERQTALLVSS